MAPKSDPKSDVTLKLECVKIAQKILPGKPEEDVLALAHNLFRWVLARDGRPPRCGQGSVHSPEREQPLREALRFLLAERGERQLQELRAMGAKI